MFTLDIRDLIISFNTNLNLRLVSKEWNMSNYNVRYVVGGLDLPSSPSNKYVPRKVLKKFNIVNLTIFKSIKIRDSLSISLKTLICSYTGIRKLPNMQNLTTLICVSSDLMELPNLPNLTYLDCGDTFISELPNMPNLAYLDCRCTRIKELRDLPNLTFLGCDSSGITSVSNLPKLRELICDDTFNTRGLNIKVTTCFKCDLRRVPSNTKN